MKTIVFTSNFANFDYSATIQMPDEVLSPEAERYIRKGVANDMYRAAGSSVQKEFEAEFPAVKVRDKAVPADERGRRAVPYNTDTVAKFTKLANEACVAIAKEDGGPLITVAVTGQHEFNKDGDAPTKEATELWTSVQGKVGEAFEKALKVLGLDETYTDESGVLACKRFLQEAKRKAKEAAVNALG